MADSGSMRLRSVQAPIIPLVDQLIQQCPGTISFGQGVVHYGPPDQAKKRLQDFWSDAAHHKYGPILGDAGPSSMYTGKTRKGEPD